MAVGVFPLVPRRRVIGLAFGGVRSVRRGTGSDVAGSREYQPGDDVAWIDWAASARVSAARADDRFIVRELFADEAPRVVVLADRCPSMGIPSSPLRSLDKPGALLAILDLIGESARTARSLTGYLDYAYGEPYWRPPRSEHAAEPGTFARPFRAPDGHRLARARATSRSTGATCPRRRSSSSSPTSSCRRTSGSGSGRSSTAGRSCPSSCRIPSGS